MDLRDLMSIAKRKNVTILIKINEEKLITKFTTKHDGQIKEDLFEITEKDITDSLDIYRNAFEISLARLENK